MSYIEEARCLKVKETTNTGTVTENVESNVAKTVTAAVQPC